MASGRLGVASPTAATNTAIYTVPANTVATINISVVNRGVGDASVNVAISTSTTTPADAEYVEYGALVPRNGGVLERTALVVGAGENVVVRSSVATCSFRIHGFEESL